MLKKLTKITLPITLVTCSLPFYTTANDEEVIHLQNQVNTAPDNTAPIITLIGPRTMTLSLNEPFIDPGAVALDDRDYRVRVFSSGKVNSSIGGTYTVTYQARDTSGNVGYAQRLITVEDPILQFSLIGERVISMSLNEEYKELGAKVLSSSGKPVEVEISHDIDTSKVGVYIVRYRINGHEHTGAREIRRAVVVANEEPTRVASEFIDINGDTILDTVTVSDNGIATTLSWKANYADESDAQVQKIDLLPTEQAYSLYAHDMNGDGIGDIFLLTNRGWYIYINEGSGNFSNPVNIRESWPSYAQEDYAYDAQDILIEDVTGDGIADIFFTAESTEFSDYGETRFYTMMVESNGDNDYYSPRSSFVSYSYAQMSDIIISTGQESFQDVNHDGIKDLVYISHQSDYTDPLNITYSKIKARRFDQYQVIDLYASTNILSFKFLYWNNDGKEDLYVHYLDYETVNYYERKDIPVQSWLTPNGAGLYDNETVVTSEIDDNTAWLFDLNRDGYQDILSLEKLNEQLVYSWRSGSKNGFNDKSVFVTTTYQPLFKDLDNNGTIDFIEATPEAILLHTTSTPGMTTTRSLLRNTEFIPVSMITTDVWPPIVELNGSEQVNLTKGQQYTELGAIGNDALDGLVDVQISGEVNTQEPGSYKITYSASDKAGNQALITRTVVVTDE